VWRQRNQREGDGFSLGIDRKFSSQMDSMQMDRLPIDEKVTVTLVYFSVFYKRENGRKKK